MLNWLLSKIWLLKESQKETQILVKNQDWIRAGKVLLAQVIFHLHGCSVAYFQNEDSVW